MPTLKSLYEAKCKKIAEDMENHINTDILQQINDDKPLSTQQDIDAEKEKKEKVVVPNSEKIEYEKLKDDIKSIFKKIILFTKDDENIPEDYDAVGYCFSLIFKKGKAIDFSGGYIQSTNDVGTEEYFVSFDIKDANGMYQFYKISIKHKGETQEEIHMAKKKSEAPAKKTDIIDDIIANVLKESRRLSDTKDDYKILQWFDTGNLMLNMLITGDFYKGIPDNRAFQVVGDPSSSKSYITKQAMKSAILQGWKIIYIDTEGDIEISDYERAGLDTNMILIVEDIDTTKSLNTKLMNIIKLTPPNAKIMIVIDSIGNLASDKEVSDTLSGEHKQDMTRAKDLKSLFRQLLNKAFRKRIPILMINHQYDSIGMFSKRIVGGGKGSQFASSFIIELWKKPFKIGDKVVGIEVTATNSKNRFVKEGFKCSFVIHYDHGLLRYSGLYEALTEHGIVTKKNRGSLGAHMVIGDDMYRIKDLTGAMWEEVIAKHNLNEKLGSIYKYQQKNMEDLEIEDVEEEIKE